MNKDQLKGKYEELKGKARQAFGNAKETAQEKGKEASSSVERERARLEEKAAQSRLEDEGGLEKGEPDDD